MEATNAFALIAILGAFGCGALCLRGILTYLRRHQLLGDTVSGHSGSKGAFEVFLRHGLPPLIPLSKRVLKNKRVAQFVGTVSSFLDERGIEAPAVPLCSAILSIFFGAFMLFSLVGGSILTGFLCAAAAVALLATRVRSWSESRNDAIRSDIPDALQSMAACSQSGFSLLQTLQQVSSESKSGLRELFENGAHVLQAGGTARDALRCLQGNKRMPELSFIAVALDVQHQTGGSMRQVLDAAKDMVEGELELQRMLKVQTAQARLSARVVTVMPFVMLALLSLFSSDFLSAFFQSALGVVVLALALTMQVTGVLLVRRLLQVGE